MNFFGILIAILLALYLTGNVQDGSILAGHLEDFFTWVAFGIFIGLSMIAILIVKLYGASPKLLWAKYKNGELFNGG